MRSTLALSLLTGAMTVAAQTTADVFLPIPFDNVGFSIVGKDSTHTTYALYCPPGTDSDECGVPGTVTVVQASSSVGLYFKDPEMFLSIDCQLSGTTYASCVASQTVSEFATALTTTFGPTDMPYYTATMADGAGSGPLPTTGAAATATTAGVTVVMTEAVASIGSGASTLSKVASSASASPSDKAVEETSSGSTPSETGTATETKNAGMAQVTGAHWVVGGAAMVALAMA